MPAPKKLSKKLLLLTRSLHIYMSMLALLLLLFFAVTGFMMNHPDWFKIDETSDTKIDATIPAAMLQISAAADAAPQTNVPAVTDYLRTNYGVKGEVDSSGANDDPAHLTIKGPHYRYEIDITRSDGHASIDKTTTSLTGFLGNLHKGSDAGPIWKRIVDATSILLAFVSVTGLVLWMTLGKRRVLGLISLAACIVICVGAFFLFLP